MKVLITNAHLRFYGGAERLIVRLCNYLTDHYIEHALLAPEIAPEIVRQLKETRFIVVPNPAEYLSAIIEDFDVVNAHNDPAQFFSIPKRKPLVWMCNEPPLAYLAGGTLPERDCFLVRNYVTRAVVADEYNQRRFKKLYGLDAMVNPYGIEFDAFQNGQPERMIERYGLRDRFVIFHVGLMVFTKNQLGTVDIFKDVKKRIPHATLVFAGHDRTDYYQEVVRKVRAEQVSDVVFAGELPTEDVRDLYHASHVVISPIMAQGGWLNVFEAMAAGRPVVVSEDMTASSLLRKNRIGYVARTKYRYYERKWLCADEHQESPDFADQIVEIYEKKITRDDRGREWVRDNLSWDRYCAAMVKCYEEVLP